MTIEEKAIANLKYAIRWNDKPTQKSMEIAIASLEAWEKVKAEIDEQYDRVHPYNISCAEGLEMALEIIDKYKASPTGEEVEE